ncbi:ribose-5-phosphate isomerase RpiA [Oceanomicrobium pacificus]|uniref:Ribose-5-phosphate isomerase A n=1 Tax=Oceanomicrobium pacificus TaxID=2692916 RepID=A0A6B0TWX9_9RHOB|nr:ribose-5-phosphate isomerase RpiA [Oceanomicrobium pacificus]MXU65533.1 ribose-5-phosphate isomerase RpiA [Oceanomicrobium pacificus]
MQPATSPAERAKFYAARHALKEVKSGMRVGLGTGSTAAWFVKLLGERVAKEGLEVRCAATSTRTADMARELGIPLFSLDELGWLDVTFDGADEVDPKLNLIKGGGGALLQEKIVATASDRMVVLTDSSKEVDTLGAFPLPVEIVRFGWETTQSLVTEALDGADVMGHGVSLRKDRDQPYVTDEGHYILDLHLRRIGKPRALSNTLLNIAGVVETGLFLDIADSVVIGSPSGEVRVRDLEGEAHFTPSDEELESGSIFSPDY